MLSRTLRSTSLGAFSLLFLAFLFLAPPPASADLSHIRIIRISYVQGDVRFARDIKGDPLAGNDNITWENAELNLPIRQGFVLNTERGRAEVEFENGSVVVLGDNTVLQFFDLSLEDGAKTTRLILRQGTASFYVNPGNGDYFSVTGGDFSVETDGRAAFRLDNFDDGSKVNVTRGHISVLRKKGATPLEKGQSLSMSAGDPKDATVAAAAAPDAFDNWVASRVKSEADATTVAQNYVNSSNYASGLSSLYTYGAFYPCGAAGNCWRPYGVGSGWSPFNSANGSWFTDPSIGMSFIGSQPWGWLPYHYGGWLFDPSYGWLWSPYANGGGGLGYGGGPIYSPVTGTWLRGKGNNGPVGIVPTHPLDASNKAPLNLARGIYPVNNGAVERIAVPATGVDWKLLKTVPNNTVTSHLNVAVPPARVSRTMTVGNASSTRGSTVAFDASSHRFVNSNAAVPASRIASGAVASSVAPAARVAVNSNARPGAGPANARNFSMASRSVTPPSAPRTNNAGFGRFDASHGGGASGSSARSASSAASAASASAARASSSSASGGSGSGASSGARAH
jgi:hypothetical protein